MSLAIEIAMSEVPEILNLPLALRDPQPMNRAGAEGMKVPIQRRFVANASSNRNRFGAPSSFWQRMNAGTVAGANAQQGWVRMPREVAARTFGATIVPTGGRKYLTIAASAASYGKSARQFSDLRFVQFGRGGAKALVTEPKWVSKLGRQRKDGSRKQTRTWDAGGVVMYWLVPQVVLRGQRDLLPSDEELRAAAIRGVRTYAKTALARLRKGGA